MDASISDTPVLEVIAAVLYIHSTESDTELFASMIMEYLIVSKFSARVD